MSPNKDSARPSHGTRSCDSTEKWQDLPFWLFQRGLKVNRGTVKWYRTSYGTDFDNSGIATPDWTRLSSKGARLRAHFRRRVLYHLLNLFQELFPTVQVLRVFLLFSTLDNASFGAGTDGQVGNMAVRRVSEKKEQKNKKENQDKNHEKEEQKVKEPSSSSIHKACRARIQEAQDAHAKGAIKRHEMPGWHENRCPPGIQKA